MHPREHRGDGLDGRGSGSAFRVLNAGAAVSVEMALALEALGWGSADYWVRMQGDYDMPLARRARARIDVDQTGIRSYRQ